MNRLLEMEIFVRVVDAGSISGAAQRMDVAKSAVSRRLAGLESRLGVQLLNRTTRRLSLTEAGGNFYERCTNILAEVTDAEGSVAAADASFGGKLRVAAPLSFGLLHLGPAINDCMREHPEASFDIDFNDRQIDLVQEGFDLAIRIADLADSSLVARRLTTVRHVVCASPDYWEKHGKPGQPGDLKNHLALRYSNVTQRAWHYTTPGGTRGSVAPADRISASNGDYLRQAAVAGLGVLRTPVFIAYQSIEAGELVPVLTDYRWNDLHAYAVYPATRYLPRRVRMFVDFLADRFGDEPYWDLCLREFDAV